MQVNYVQANWANFTCDEPNANGANNIDFAHKHAAGLSHVISKFEPELGVWLHEACWLIIIIIMIIITVIIITSNN